MSLQELPVRPRPLENESIEGYLLRVTARNGWQEIRHLLNHIGLSSSYLIDNQTKLKQLCEKIAPCTRMQPQELYNHFAENMNHSWLYEETRAIQDLRTRFPRLCPLCVNNTGFHWHWSLAVVSHCEQHDHPLWDSCPSCGESFNWHSSLFFGCPKCGTDWKPEQLPQLPEHQRKFQEKLSSGIGLESYIQDLCLALRALSRPYDPIHDKLSYWPTEQRNLAEMLSNAHGLLTQQIPLNVWIIGCIKKRSELRLLGIQTLLWPIIKFRKELREHWPIHESSLHFAPLAEVPRLHQYEGKTSAMSGIRPARLKHVKVESDLYFQARRQEVIASLGLPKGSMDSLIKTGLIKPINDKRTARDQFFDLRDLPSLLCLIPEKDECPDGYTVLQNRDQRLRHHRVLYADIVASSLTGKTPAFRPKGSYDLSMVWIDEEALSIFLSNACESFARNR
ncbi:TniQ family protein [Amphritea balenae]|uniref:TniQ domain-containing protein n=1 Tax=Amphritea balenae TaxID=452629 RepID=A0A3P1SLZ7_9GAMM|nr:TniQ family protein [Amphritea balenae]RRC98273.1 hypothetical protein EHS89_14370 [Amphritea balenae]